MPSSPPSETNRPTRRRDTRSSLGSTASTSQQSKRTEHGLGRYAPGLIAGHSSTHISTTRTETCASSTSTSKNTTATSLIFSACPQLSASPRSSRCAGRNRLPRVSREGFEARYIRLKVAAELYSKDRRILTVAYNKTKHGAPMVRLLNPENFRQFEFVVPDRNKSGDDRYQLAKFTVTKTMIETLEANIASMTTSIRELAGLTKLINMAGLLYERSDYQKGSGG